MNIDLYIEELKKLVDKAIKHKEVPIAAIIIKDGKIISKAFNKRHRSKNVLGHAEVSAVIKASKKLKDWRLDDCVLITTLKPCQMCREVIIQSRIKKVYYILNKRKKIVDNLNIKKIKVAYEGVYRNQLNTFFKSKR